MITLITMKMSLRTESNLRNPFKFPKAVDVAKRYTGEQDNRTAITAFKAVLRHSNMSFNNKPFPANESDENAYIKCYDDKSAQGYCPERWYSGLSAGLWVGRPRFEPWPGTTL